MQTSSINQVPRLIPEDRRADRLGSILVEQGRMTEDDAERIARLQEQNGLKFGQTAMKLGLASEQDIRQALALQFQFPFTESLKDKFSSCLDAIHRPESDRTNAVRELRSHLLLRWFSEGHKSLSVVTGNEGAGGSVLTANLAILFSYLHKRTVLVDANLKARRQSTIFNMQEAQGLSDMLSGRVGMEVVRTLAPFKYFSILPAGTVPPNPNELLSLAEFGRMHEMLQSRFDIVLYDLPALSDGAEALSVACETGGMIVAIQKDSTKVQELSMVKARIAGTNIRLVGCVLVRT